MPESNKEENIMLHFLYSIGCCHSLNLTLANEAKAMYGNLEGVFTFSGIFSSGIDAFSDGNGHAIAHVVQNGAIFWYIYPTATNIPVIYASTNDLELYQKCPNNEGYTWKNWVFWNGLGYELGGNDINLKCVDEGDFCTPNSRCGLDQGDCDVHEDCQSGFACGSNNCPDSLGYGTDVDCCFEATLGHLDYCTTKNKCGVNEGDCDKHDECQSGLVCGNGNCDSTLDAFSDESDCCYNAINGDPEFCTAENPCAADEGDCDTHTECQTGLFCDYMNDCPASLGFATGTNCCGSEQSCGGNTGWIGDSACDDVNNNEECQWDGGDCCGDNVNAAWCSVCACLDPGFGQGNTTASNRNGL